MSFNISGIIDPKQFFIINSAIHVTFFGILSLPTIILTGVCVVALLLATAINLQMRAVLINAFTAEINYSIFSCFLNLGYPIRAWSDNEVGDILCSITFSILLIYTCANLCSIILCAVMIHRFIKYGKDRLNWKIIIVSIVLLWIVSFAVGALPYSVIKLRAHLGFCVPDRQRNLQSVGGIGLGIFPCFCVVLIFSILTYHHMKKNAPDSNVKVKKAVFKILVYHAIKLAVLLFQNVIVAILNIILQNYVEKKENLSKIATGLTITFITRVSYDISALLTPIVSIIILKPVLDALKNASRLICVLCSKDCEDVNAETAETEKAQ